MKLKFTLKLALIALFTFVSYQGLAVNDTLLQTGSVWKYKDNGSNQGTAWRATSFSDASWASGPSRLGYGNGNEATVVSYGSSSSNKYVTTYFRKSINISAISAYTSMTMRVKRDDGIVVYINGTQRYRNNMSSSYSYTTLASATASDDGGTWQTVTISLSNFVSGNNVIAVEIHQSAKNSSDIAFDMLLFGNINCGTPAGLSSTSITTNSASANWGLVSGASGYKLEYKTAASSTWSSVTVGNVASYTISGLNYNTAYNWRVSAICSGGSGTATTTQNFTTLTPVCNVASSLSSNAVTTSSATVSWAAVTGASSYDVQYRVVGAGSWSASQNTTTTSKSLTGLNYTSNYEWQVRTNCVYGNQSAYSASATFTTLTPACAFPTGQTSSSITVSSASVSWAAVTGASSYDVQYRVVGAGSWSAAQNTTTTSKSLTGLIFTTNYEWQVRTNCVYGNQSAYSASATFTTATPPCNNAANLYVSNITTDGADLSWSAVSGANYYNVSYRLVGSGAWTTVSPVTNSVSISGLDPAASYQWSVQTVCQYGNSNVVNGNNFTTGTPPCNSAINLNVSNITTTSADLNWDAVSGANSYHINYRIVGTGSWSTTSTSNNAVSISGLTPAANYEWNVGVVCQYNNGNIVSGANFATATPVCNDAANLAVNNITTSSADLSWDAVIGAVSYDVYFRLVGGSTWSVVTATTNAVSISGLDFASAYEWQVQSTCQYSNGNLISGNNFSTATPPCNDANNLIVGITTPTTVDLSWDAVAGANSYNINYRITGSGSWSTNSSATNSLSLMGLSNGAEYEWQVQSVCQYGSSKYASGTNFTLTTPTCNNATNLSVTNVTSTTANLSWDAVAGAVSYNIEYQDSGMSGWANTSSPTNSTTLTGLNPSSLINWKVEAVCMYGNSGIVDGPDFSTSALPCPDVTNLQVLNITTTSADLEWNAAVGAVSYNVNYREAGSGTWTAVTSSTSSYSVTGLTPAEEYEWMIESVCSTNSGNQINGNNFSTLTPPCDDAANLSVNNITTTSADLNWDVVGGSISYDVSYRIVGASVWDLVSTVSNSLSLTGLDPASNYEWQVEAVCQYSNNNAVAGNNFQTLTPPCVEPSGLSTSSITTSSASVSWSAVTGASSYDVQYRVVGAGSWSAAQNSTTTSKSLTGLNYSSNYEWQVRTNCVYGNQSAYSASTTFTTLTPTCAVPTGQAASSITTSSASVSWSAVTGVSSYDVQYRVVGAGSWSAAINTGSTSLALSSLNYTTNYEWQVRTNCVYGNQSAYSASTTFTTLTPACSVPTGQAASSITTSSASVSWVAVTGASSYDVLYRVVGAGSWSAAQNSTTTSKSLTGLNYSSNYEWQVRTNCVYGNQSAYSASTTFTTLTPACSVPTGQAASSITISSASVSWSAVTGASSYDVQYRVVGAGSWSAAINTGSTSLALSSLNYTTNYEWQVRTNCVYGNQSAYSASSTFTTLTPTCSVPTGQAASSITTSSASVSWSAVTGASSYDVQYRVVGAGSWSAAQNTTTTSKSLTGLNYTSNYEWQVRTNCVYGNQSAYSASSTFTTLTPVCDVPTGQTASSITTSSASVSWSAVTGASSYDVQYRVVGAGSWSAAINTGSTSLALSSLSYSSNYEWQVRTNCVYGNQSAYSASSTFTTLTPTCAVPTGQAASSITTSSASVSWSAVTGASSYDVQYRVVGAGSWSVANTATTSLALSSLSYSSNYEWQVRTNCVYGNQSAYSTSSTFTTSSPVCDIPTGLMSGTVSNATAKLFWDVALNASSYNVRYRINGGSTWTIQNAASTNITISGLAASTKYEAQVSTDCSGNSSAYSSSINFTTSANATTDSLVFANGSWKYFDLGTSPATGWQLLSFNDASWLSGNAELGYGDGGEATVVSYGPNSSSKYITTYFRKTINVTNASTYTSLALNVVRDDGIVVYINGTEVYRTNMPTGTITNSTLATAAIAGTDESAWISSVIPATALVNGFNEIAVEIHQSGVTSSDISFNLNLGGNLPLPTCTIPSAQSSSSITTTSASVSWSAVTAASSYDVQYRVVGVGGWSAAQNTVTTSASLTGLNPGSNYEWQVRTNCTYGNQSAYSASANFTTLTPACNIPSGFSSSAITSSSATVSWGAVSGAANYDVQYRVVGAGSWNTTNTGAASLSLSGLTASTNYEWQVRTNCVYGNQSTYSASVTFTTSASTPCSTPNNLAIASVTTTGATASWTAVSGALTYTVRYRTIGNASWTTPANTASTSLAITGLTTSKTYEVQVATNCSGGSSAYSASVDFTTAAATTILSRSAYLQIVTPTSIRIRWRSSAATNSLVRFGTTMALGSTVTDATSLTEHEVQLTGLTPGTKYFYTIGSTTVDYQGDLDNYFVTSLPTGSTAPFRVWATGDFGTNNAGQKATRDAMWTYTAGNRPNLWIWMGDNAYNSGTDAEYTNNVFNIYPNQMKSVPIYSCLGNHDYANVGYKSTTALGTGFPYFSMFSCPTAAEAGGIPSSTEKYYSYNYGNVHFIVLDSYGSLNATGTAQYTWLQNDLAANTQRFTVVMFHHAPYSHGTHNSDTETELIDMRNNFTPLFDLYKVDLVLNGHSHSYERTWLIKGHQGVASTFTNAMKVDATNGLSPYYLKSAANSFNGTVYCLCGVSGQGGAVSTAGTWPHNAMVQYSKALYGSMVIDFSSDTLDAKFLTSTGTIYDRFKIVKTGAARLASNTIVTGTKGNEVEAFPNPFSNELNIRFMLSDDSKVLVEVYDLLGQKIYSSGNKISGMQQAGTYELMIEGDELRNLNGMAIIRVTANGKVMQTIVDRVK